MNKKELVRCVTGILKNGNIRKHIAMPAQEFRISDQYGHSEVFRMTSKYKDIPFTQEDVLSIINATLCAVIEALKRGEEVSIKGFGSFELHHRAARRVKNPTTNEWYDVDARYVPKFRFGEMLRQLALNYDSNKAVHNGQEEMLNELSVTVRDDSIHIENMDDEMSFEEFFFRITGEKLDDAEV